MTYKYKKGVELKFYDFFGQWSNFTKTYINPEKSR